MTAAEEIARPGSVEGRLHRAAFAGATTVSGVLWWWVATIVGDGQFGSGYVAIDLPAAALTGALVGYASLPLYRSASGWLQHLLWLAPLSLYLASAVWVTLFVALDLLIVGPEVTGASWGGAGGMTLHYEGMVDAVEWVVAAWWGLTFTGLLLGLVPLSVANHAALRWLVREAPLRTGRA